MIGTKTVAILRQGGHNVLAASPKSRVNTITGENRYLKAVGDPHEVVSDPEARYWGGRVDDHSLVPLGEARLGRIGFDEWFPAHRQEFNPQQPTRIGLHETYPLFHACRHPAAR
jgi:hypothetical protein